MILSRGSEVSFSVPVRHFLLTALHVLLFCTSSGNLYFPGLFSRRYIWLLAEERKAARMLVLSGC